MPLKKYAKDAFWIATITVALLLALDAGSVLFLKIYKHNDPRAKREAYRGQDWVKDYFPELRAADRMEYDPYTDFHRKGPFDGTYIHIDERSRRRTVGNCPSGPEDTVRIFLFGGSTMWGSGARDEGTIASHLARLICQDGVAVEVTNFGEDGYVNTQEVIRLLLEVRAGNVPDFAVFYDGYNDVFAAYQSGTPGLPPNVHNRFADFNAHRRVNLKASVFHFLDLISRIAQRMRMKNWIEHSYDSDLARRYADVYGANRKLVEALQDKFQFQSFFLWQPTLYSKKTLSDDERAAIPLEGPFGRLYREATEKVRADGAVLDLSGLFDDHPESVYIDQVHLSEDGNLIVARRMADILLDRLREKP